MTATTPKLPIPYRFHHLQSVSTVTPYILLNSDGARFKAFIYRIYFRYVQLLVYPTII